MTFLNGVKPYTYSGHNGQMGNVTYFNYQAPGTVPVTMAKVLNLKPVPGSGAGLPKYCVFGKGWAAC